MKEIKVCPLCGKEYSEPAALSRTDNQTWICPDCGTRQALESMGVDKEEQDKILDIIHRSARPINNMCKDCRKLGKDCKGTFNPVWTNCIRKITWWDEVKNEYNK